LVVSGFITSHAKEDAQVDPRPKTFPVIIYSPGAFMSSFQSTSFIEDLVSHGFIVASVEHVYETFAVWFPDGRVIAYSPKDIQTEFLPPPGANQSEFGARLQAWSRHRAEVRAADLSFALSKLIELNNGQGNSRLRGHLDLAHVAAVGHSRGGWAAVIACRKDSRFSACVNLDGNAAGEGLSFPHTPEPTQPVLFVEVKPQIPSDWIVLKDLHISAEDWIRRWHKIAELEFQKFPAGGDFVELTTPGLNHNSFTDEAVLRSEKDGQLKDYHNALEGLRLSERVTRIFLNQELKLDKKATLRNTPAVKVREFPRRRLQKQ
jgi:pimeloyl-ACP methyl ester carboxylesterase